MVSISNGYTIIVPERQHCRAQRPGAPELRGGGQTLCADRAAADGSRGTNAQPIVSRPDRERRSGRSRRRGHHAVTRIWPAIVTSPDTANRSHAVAVATSSPTRRRGPAAGGPGRPGRTARTSRSSPAANSTNGRLRDDRPPLRQRARRHPLVAAALSAAVPAAPGPGRPPAPRRRRRRPRRSARKSTPVSTSPTSGPSRMPAW